MTGEAVALVVAKAPVAGRVKTRLGSDVGMERAARLAAAALVDTVRRCTDAFGAARCHLALAGRLEDTVDRAELETSLRGWTVHPQRGDGLAARLRHAHEDAAASGAPVVQVGMDTPQVRAEMLRDVAAGIADRRSAVLGPALDGGWWLLAVGSSELVAGLDEVPMSTAATAARTTAALRAAGARVRTTVPLRDVDTARDADLVASEAPHTRFAEVWRAGAGR
jgi:glycosyltransferase A (GT-A) superfamily protein (DUF2064 family)